MKVDLGTCAVCGAKNSKFVEACYKCGVPLPWAPNYVAPKAPQPKAEPQNTPAPQATPAPKPAPRPASPPANEVKTVVSPPLDSDEIGAGKSSLSGSMSERAARRVPIPTWAIGLGVLGCMALGMALVMAFGGRTSTPPAVVPATTPTSAPATNAVSSPAAPTAVPTVAPTPTSAPVATIAPTLIPTAAPIVRVGPSFDEVDSKMDDRSNGLTEAQKQTYWQSVSGSTVRWRGAVVEARLSGGGQISLRCGKQTLGSDVEISLDGSQSQLLGQISKGENLTFEGILADHTGSGYTVSQGKIVSRG